MNQPPSIQPGSRVTLHLAIRLEGGQEVESSFGGEPLAFTLGDGTMVEGLERHLLGLRAGERAHFTVGPDEAFGPRDPDNVHDMPRTDFPLELSEGLQPGQIIAFQTPTGDDLPGLVLEVEIDRVKVDFNPPLAGRTVQFEVEILAVE